MKPHISFTNGQHNVKLLITVMKQCEGKGMEVCTACGDVDNTVTYRIKMCNLVSVRQPMRIQFLGVNFQEMTTILSDNSPQLDWIPFSKENEKILQLWNKKNHEASTIHSARSHMT